MAARSEVGVGAAPKVVERVVEIVNQAGLHARPVMQFVDTASRYQASMISVDQGSGRIRFEEAIYSDGNIHLKLPVMGLEIEGTVDLDYQVLRVVADPSATKDEFSLAHDNHFRPIAAVAERV